MTLRIDAMTPHDWPEVHRIYEEALATGVATFETAAPSWEQWDAARLPHSRLVARRDTVIAFAALSPVSSRSCYAGVAEVGIYVTAADRGHGVGQATITPGLDAWHVQPGGRSDSRASVAAGASCSAR